MSRRDISRRELLTAAVSVAGLSLLPKISFGSEAVTANDCPIADSPYYEGSSEVINLNNESASISYSYEDGYRIVRIDYGCDAEIVVKYDTTTGILYADDKIVGSSDMLDGQNPPFAAYASWTEFDRGRHSLTWVVGSSAVYIAALVSACIGIAVVDIIFSSLDALSEIAAASTSMDLLCIWEQYYTVTYQQVRVKCYYQPTGKSYGPFIWHFSNV